MVAYAFAGQYGPENAIGATGAPLPLDSFSVFLSGTRVLAPIFTDRTARTPAANPCQADVLGNLTVFALPGHYDVEGNGTSVTVCIQPDPADIAVVSQIGSTPTGAKGDGATDDTAALNTWLAGVGVNGGIASLPTALSGAYGIKGRVVVPGNVRLIGGGSGWQPSSGSAPGAAPYTTIKCLTSGAGVDFVGGTGGSTEHITIDGNSIATQPLRDGVSVSEFPQDRMWVSVYVLNSAQDGWAICASQNSTYINCRTVNAARDALVIDGNAGGLNFYNWKDLTFTGRWSINAPNLISGGPYGNITGDVTFFGGVLDYGAGQTQLGKVNLVAAAGWTFAKMPIVGLGCTGPVVVIDTSTCNNIDLGKSLLYAPAGIACLHVAGAAGGFALIDVGGVEFVEGGTSIYVATGATTNIQGYTAAQDFTTNGPVAQTGDINLILPGRVGKWQAATYLNTWAALPGQDALAYRISADGDHVELRGTAGSGTDNTVVFQLPAGYRPLSTRLVPVAMSGGMGALSYSSLTFNVTIAQFSGASSTTGTFFYSISLPLRDTP